MAPYITAMIALSLRSFFFNHTGVTSIHYQAVFVLVLDTG
jgi:hypothetical protein